MNDCGSTWALVFAPLLLGTLFGAVVGSLGIFYAWLRLARDPSWLGSALANTLRAAAARCRREHVHLQDELGAVHLVHIESLCYVLQTELTTWQEQHSPPDEGGPGGDAKGSV